MAPICLNFKMQSIKLSPRLEAAAMMVGKGTVADIGTDHAYLPIKLVQMGHSKALASDIGEGPCQRARVNIYSHGLHGKIKVVCCAGLDAVPDFRPDNIIICGMGGETIRDILAESDYPKESKCRLILGPQSMHSTLRKYLYENCFFIDEEKVVFDGGKFYQLIAAHYDPDLMKYKPYEYELVLGKLNLERALKNPTDDDKMWLKSVLNTAKLRASSRSVGGNGVYDNAPEQQLDLKLIEIIENILG